MHQLMGDQRQKAALQIFLIVFMNRVQKLPFAQRKGNGIGQQRNAYGDAFQRRSFHVGDQAEHPADVCVFERGPQPLDLCLFGRPDPFAPQLLKFRFFENRDVRPVSRRPAVLQHIQRRQHVGSGERVADGAADGLFQRTHIRKQFVQFVQRRSGKVGQRSCCDPAHCGKRQRPALEDVRFLPQQRKKFLLFGIAPILLLRKLGAGT